MSSFGEELKRERELRGISLREVAENTKVNLRYLSALESNEFEHLPGGVFNRGFVRAYAQYIGVDPDAMVDAYTLEEQGQASRGRARDRDSFHRPQRNGAGRPAADRAGRPRPGRSRALLRWALILLVAGALVAAAAMIYLRWSDRSGLDSSAGPAAGPVAVLCWSVR
jgi:cytoskeletal protein RodZ